MWMSTGMSIAKAMCLGIILEILGAITVSTAASPPSAAGEAALIGTTTDTAQPTAPIRYAHARVSWGPFSLCVQSPERFGKV